MTKKNLDRLSTIIAKIESLQAETKLTQVEKDALRAAKQRLIDIYKY